MVNQASLAPLCARQETTAPEEKKTTRERVELTREVSIICRAFTDTLVAEILPLKSHLLTGYFSSTRGQ